MNPKKVDSAERLRRELETTELLLDALKALSATIDLGSLLEQLADIALQFTGLPRAFVNTVDEHRRMLVPMVATDGVTLPANGPAIGFDQLSGTSLGAILAKKTAILDFEAPGIPPHDREIANANHSRLVLFVPLLVRGEIVGHISLDEPDARHSFSDREIELVEGIASQAAIAIQNARLFEAEASARQAAARELETTALLLDGATVLADAPDLGKGLHALIGKMRMALPGIRLVIYELVEGRSELEVLASGGGPAPPDGARLPLSRMTSAAARIIETKRAEVIDFDALLETERGIADDFGVHLLHAIPLVYQDHVSGIVVVDDPAQERRLLSPREVGIVEAFVTRAAVAIENARLFKSEQKRAEQLATLKTVAEIASSSLDASEIAIQIVARVASSLAARQVQLRLLSDDGTSLESAGAFDPDGFLAAMGAMAIGAYTATSECFRSGTMSFSEDIALGHVSGQSESNARAAAVRSYILLPITAGDQPIGTFYVAWADPRHFAPEELSFIESVVAQFTAGLQNARLYAQQAEQMRFATALNGINAVVHGALDFDEIMNRVVVRLAEAMGVDAVGIHMRKDASWSFSYQYGLPEGLRDSRLTDAEARVSSRVRETREMLVAHDVVKDLRANPALSQRFGTTALLAAPLIARDEIVAVMLIFRFGGLGGFSEAQVDFARKAAVTLGLAIENARLYEAEHRIADRLQTALLAMPETIEGIDFSYAYHSASDATRVGGDFYDIFELDEYRVGVTIGDVAGKGLNAAVLTSLAKNTIRAHAAEHGKTPAEVLGLTNQVVYRGTPTESFVTICFGVLDRRDGTLSYCNAGHTTGAVVRDGGTVVALPPTGPIVGAIPNLEFGQAELGLAPGDSLFLYTDGLTEARLDQVSFAEKRLFDFLSAHREGPTESLVTEVVDFVMSLTECRLRDDLAILAVRLETVESSTTELGPAS